jgi:outer membrane protein
MLSAEGAVMKRVICGVIAVASAFAVGNCAMADEIVSELSPRSTVPVTDTGSPWLVRMRALGVITNDHSSVHAGGARVSGGETSISDSVIPELDISYFFTENIAAELILGTTRFSAKGGGSLSGLGPLGRGWLLPPTLTVQYHFTDFGSFKPYVGAGVNYSVFYGLKDKTLTDFKVDDAVGFALQVGADFMIDEHWGINLDVKKIFLNTTARGRLGDVPVKANLDLDPWLIGAGISYKF